MTNNSFIEVKNFLIICSWWIQKTGFHLACHQAFNSPDEKKNKKCKCERKPRKTTKLLSVWAHILPRAALGNNQDTNRFSFLCPWAQKRQYISRIFISHQNWLAAWSLLSFYPMIIFFSYQKGQIKRKHKAYKFVYKLYVKRTKGIF